MKDRLRRRAAVLRASLRSSAARWGRLREVIDRDPHAGLHRVGSRGPRGEVPPRGRSPDPGHRYGHHSSCPPDDPEESEGPARSSPVKTVHRRPAALRAARATRDISVPWGMPRIAAASATPSPSRATRCRASRWSGARARKPARAAPAPRRHPPRGLDEGRSRLGPCAGRAPRPPERCDGYR